jgi:hypothetical protein
MVQTYELYFDDENGARCFEPMLAASMPELIDKVRQFVAERRIKTVEVCLHNERLLTISAGSEA